MSEQTNEFIKNACSVIRTEIDGLNAIIEQIDESFSKVIDLILSVSGRVFISGVGKSGIVGRKIAATLSSTGTPAFYFHPTEAGHGDLGMVTSLDLMIFLSYSGETEELLQLISPIKKLGIKLISLTGNPQSSVAKYSDFVLKVKVPREACPYNLAPTASTTAMLALGDALAITLLRQRNFTPEQFAMFHPGGSLGKRLLISVGDVMWKDDKLPKINLSVSVSEMLEIHSQFNAGGICIVDENDLLLGIITDGDIRRGLRSHPDFMNLPIEDIMTVKPITIKPESLAAEAISVMENRSSQITVLPVVDKKNKLVGLVRLHDLLKAEMK